MNDQEAARVFGALKGGYPYAKVDDASVVVWANSLSSADYAAAMLAAEVWIETNDFFPTIAQFNSVMTVARRQQRDAAGPRELMGTAIRCDGTGWFDRGKGMEPCPTCNPWLRERFIEGVMDQRAKPPSTYLMPERCQPSHAGDGPIVGSRERAMQLVIGGLREQLTEDGLTPAQIDETIQRRMPTILAVLPSGDGAATD